MVEAVVVVVVVVGFRRATMSSASWHGTRLGSGLADDCHGVGTDGGSERVGRA